MCDSILNIVEFGDYICGFWIVMDEICIEMQKILSEIQFGQFVWEFVMEN